MPGLSDAEVMSALERALVILERSAELLEGGEESRWTQKAFARDANAQRLSDPTDPRAVAWCAGALFVKCFAEDHPRSLVLSGSFEPELRACHAAFSIAAGRALFRLTGPEAPLAEFVDAVMADVPELIAGAVRSPLEGAGWSYMAQRLNDASSMTEELVLASIDRAYDLVARTMLALAAPGEEGQA